MMVAVKERNPMKVKNDKFERYETKYLLPTKCAKELIELIESYIIKDEYPNYSIYNIYYDTHDSQLIRQSLDKPEYKEKLRVRSYSQETTNPNVFIELKKKFNGTVFKRRIQCALKEAINVLNLNQTMDNDSQIAHEIDYFRKKYQLEPKVYLAYDRIAYQAIEDEELRITFDYNIHARSEELSLNDSPKDISLLDSDLFLLEIKSTSAYPVWLTHALSQLHIYPTSFSKYGMMYTYLLKGEPTYV